VIETLKKRLGDWEKGGRKVEWKVERENLM